MSAVSSAMGFAGLASNVAIGIADLVTRLIGAALIRRSADDPAAESSSARV